MSGNMIESEVERKIAQHAGSLAFEVLCWLKKGHDQGRSAPITVFYASAVEEAKRVGDLTCDPANTTIALLALDTVKDAIGYDSDRARRALEDYYCWRERSLHVFVEYAFVVGLEKMYGAYEAAAELTKNDRQGLREAEFWSQFKNRFGSDNVQQLRYGNPCARLLFDDQNRPMLNQDHSPLSLSQLIGLDDAVIEAARYRSKYRRNDVG